jgi:hypothetical protein
MYFQSTDGQSPSQRTLPPDSRSMFIAKDSEHGRVLYATFRKCPSEVPQRSANDSRSGAGSDLKNSTSSMPMHYHHTVLNKATPNGEFTNWLAGGDNGEMENQIADVRRANLFRLIERDFGGNRSHFARVYDEANPRPNYFSDLLRTNSGKSFGEKVARKIEERAGLVMGQLDIPDSPLRQDENRRSRVKDDLRIALDDLDREEMREALEAIRKIQSRRRKRA